MLNIMLKGEMLSCYKDNIKELYSIFRLLFVLMKNTLSTMVQEEIVSYNLIKFTKL